jgi:hypothetical protein
MQNALIVRVAGVVLLSHLATGWAGGDALARSVAVAERGGRQPVIIIPADADQPIRVSATDLQRYLQRITGMDIPLVAGTEPKGFPIAIGAVPANRDIEAVLQSRQLGAEGYVLDISVKGIRIRGGSSLGTSYGVYDLLERMGVRWLFPGEWGEIVPVSKRVRLAAGRFACQPVFAVREMDSWAMGAPSQFDEWARRQRHNFPGFGGHSGLLCQDRYRQAHPEWFALVDGKRQHDAPEPKLCHANAEMVNQAVADTLDLIREAKRSGAHGPRAACSIISISPTDGGGFCQCAACRAMGSVSDRLQIFANIVGAAVEREFPGYGVGYYGAYSEAQEPPTVKAHANVYVFLTTWQKDLFRTLQEPSNQAFRRKVEGFLPVCPNLAVRDFDGMPVWWGWGPVSLIRAHAGDYPWYHQHGVQGILTEAVDHWAAAGQSYYVMSKLWWNPYANVEAIKKDFVRQGFGAAFRPMWRYYERINAEKSFLSSSTVLALRRDLDEAARRADRPDVQRRIDYLRAYHVILDAYQNTSAGRAEAATLRTAARLARTLTGKNVVGKILTDAVLGSAAQLPGAEPADDTPLTDSQLHEVVSRIALPAPRAELPRWRPGDDFKLVPLSRDPADYDPGMGVTFRYGPNTVLIYAEPGEPIVATTTGAGETRFELRGPEQSVLAAGTFSVEKPLRLTATSRGIYTLTINTDSHMVPLDISNRWAVIKAASVDQRLHPIGGCRQAYFYVPRGTKEFALVAKGDPGEPCIATVWGPHDAPAPRLPRTVLGVSGYEERRIEVPAGADDNIWKLKLEGEDMDVFLLGVPPLLASDPARLLGTGKP